MIKKAKFTTMKTKLLFSTLLLGGIMASCSNEEFLKEQTPSTSLPTVNVTVGASFGTDPVTRQAYGDDLSDWNYYWTSSDMLGACLPSTTNDILTNTWFSSDVKDGELVKEAVFTTSAALVTGKYLFYAPYKADMLSGKISTALPEVQVQEGTSRKHLMDNNLFITAMLDIKNDEGAQFVKDAEIELPLTFKSIYHTLDMQIGIESSTPSAITVEKIVVTPLSSDGSTVVSTNNGANLDFSAIQNAGSLNGGLVTINADAVADPDGLQDDVKTALDKIMETSAIETGGSAAENSYTLRLKDGYTYASAEDVCRAFMLIPSCTANKLKVEVYTNEGVYTETINLDGNNGATVKTFNRNGVTSIAKSLKIRYGLDNANVVKQNVFTIATAEDWNDACTYVREHFAQFGDASNWRNPTFTLAKSIEIDSYPTDFKFTLAANSAVDLTVAKDFNLSKTTLNGANVTFIVKEGTTLTFDEEVANASTNLKITNYGTIVNNIKPTTASPSLNLTFASLVNGDNVKDGKVGTINNNGVIAAAASALINNLNGVINNAAGAKINATVSSAIVNTGTINLQGENSELNVGASDAVKNDGTIKVAAKAKISGNAVAKNSEGGTIEIADVNNYTIVTTPTDQTVKVEVASLADFKKAYGKTEITNITVTDAITTDAAVTAIGKTVTVKGDLTLGNAAFTVKELVVDGDVTVAVKSGVAAATVTGNLTVNAGAKLTVNKEISFNATSSNSAKATILGDMTVNGKAYFFNATVGKDMSPATQVANGSLTVNDVDGAVFGAGDTNGVLNWGTVTQLGKGKIGPKVDNKASTSTFKGNADTSVKATNS